MGHFRVLSFKFLLNSKLEGYYVRESIYVQQWPLLFNKSLTVTVSSPNYVTIGWKWGFYSFISVLQRALAGPSLQGLTWSVAPWRMMDSRILTPAPIVTPVPIETLGPNCINSGNSKVIYAFISLPPQITAAYKKSGILKRHSLSFMASGTRGKAAYHGRGVDVGCGMDIDIT